MAILRIEGRTVSACALALAACGDLAGFNAVPAPVARIQVQVTGDLAPLRPPGTEAETPHLRVALIWAASWLPEPFCVLPAESTEAAAVIEAGCRDSFGFAPERVAGNVAVEPGITATLELDTLPAADVMVGDVTARVAYGSLVVYDDRNQSGTLELRRSHRDDFEDPPPEADAGAPGLDDLVYGASFLSMTLPDRRIAFREGEFNGLAAFYPRSGCAPPLPGFSVVSAGGFSPLAALAAALQGQLPAEDPALCDTAALAATVVSIPLQAQAGMGDARCRLGRRRDGSVRYDQPPLDAPALDVIPWACAGFPSLGSDTAVEGQQLVIAGTPDDPCKSLAHLTLRGCEDDPGCVNPQWDITATPPPWWPCQVTPSGP